MVRVYVGCYTSADRAGHGEGIAVYDMDLESGTWKRTQLLTGVINPSFLALDCEQRHLYCVHGGSNVMPLKPDGALEPPSDIVELTGEPGPDPVEQPGPHPHDIPLDPQARYVAVPDKGLDCVFTFRLDTAECKFVACDPPSVAARRGAGPRHLAFNTQAPYAYAINELDSTITTYGYDAERGVLDPLQVISSLPSEWASRNTGAEIAVAPSGKFVYASNRGHDSIGIFAVDLATGALTAVGWESTHGHNPRHFALDPAGKFLYAANQASDSIVTFRIDPITGELQASGQVVQTGSPVSIVFADTQP